MVELSTKAIARTFTTSGRAIPNEHGFHRGCNNQRNDAVRASPGDVVAVGDAYHPFVTACGYDGCYLNVFADSRRSMTGTVDPRDAHFRRERPASDPHVPLVRRSWRPD